ncbi:MAG: peptide-methionine (R)-S-oxide reductase MsrB, partial [bacterium]|nr:peptide-methionine (R)-S-oxide reductase MsrB [bacterium]
KSDEYWKVKLSDEQYKILREKGTEPPGSGKLLNNKDTGIYTCGACGQELFSSETKFDSGSGWPSFDDPINIKNIKLYLDNSLDMERTEVTCKQCGSHLGHMFDDGPTETTGKRYCVNSASLKFKKK